MAEPKKTNKKVIMTKLIKDVAAPGESAPSATSTPVIISNHARVEDPMVHKPSAPLLATDSASKLEPLKAPIPDIFDVDKQPQPAKATPAPKAKNIKAPKPAATKPAQPTKPEPAAETISVSVTKPNPTHGITLQPLTKPPVVKNETLVAVKAKPLVASQKLAEPIESGAPAPVPKPVQSMHDVVPAPVVSDIPIGDEPTKIGKADTEHDQEVAEDKKKEQAEKLQKLVDEKTYFLPIDAIEKQRTKRFVALGILASILLIVAWVDIAIDAGLISTPSTIPHTHFFSGSSSAPVTTTPAAPVVALTSYASTASNVKFNYPSTWVAHKSVSDDQEFVSLTPPRTVPNAALYSLTFSRDFSANESVDGSQTTNTVADVQYQQIPGTTAAPLYVQRFIVNTQVAGSPTEYLIYLNIVQTKSLQVGQDLGSSVMAQNQTFSVAGSTSKLMFGGIMTPINSQDIPTTGTLAQAQVFIKTNSIFKQANSILLSFRVAAE